MQRIVAHVLASFIIISLLVPAAAHAVILQCQYVDEETGAVVETPTTAAPAPIATETTTAVQLSELYPAPTTGQEEFIELYNPNNSAVSVAGLTLTDASGKAFTLSEGTIESTSLGAHAYLPLPFSVTKIFLNNGGDTIVLTNASGTTLDQTTYETALSGMSWSKHLGPTTEESTWEFTPTTSSGSANIFSTTTTTTESQVTATQTPGTGTTTETNNNPPSTTTPTANLPEEASTQTSADIVINELLPNPTGSDTNAEWIELANTGDSDVQLRDWTISDDSKTYTIKDTLLAAGELLLLQSSVTKISLNNSGETVTLTDPFGKTIDSIQYTTSAEGQSYARFHASFSWTTTPTPGAANSAHTASVVAQKTTNPIGGGVAKAVTPSTAAPAQVKTVSSANSPQTIAATKVLQDGAEVTVSGTVTALPGQLGTQYFMLQDATSGIQVYSYAKLFPGLVIGSKATVSGELGSSRGIKRIKISQASDIHTTGEIAEVSPKNVDELNETLDGTLVRTSSILTDKSGTTWNLENGISASIKSSAEVSTKDFKEGNTVSVTGIVEQVSGVRKIIPRTAADVGQGDALTQTEQVNTTASPSDNNATNSAAGQDSRAPRNTADTTPSDEKHTALHTLRAHPIMTLLVIMGCITLLLFTVYWQWNSIEQHPFMQRLLQQKHIARMVQYAKNHKLLPNTPQLPHSQRVLESHGSEPQWDFDQLGSGLPKPTQARHALQRVHIIDDPGMFYALSDEFRRGPHNV